MSLFEIQIYSSIEEGLLCLPYDNQQRSYLNVEFPSWRENLEP
jgi:hypothetical protein